MVWFVVSDSRRRNRLQVPATFLFDLECLEQRLDGGRLPKGWLPLRLMISRNRVGRSGSGLVKP